MNAERKLKKSAPDPVGSTLAKPEIKPQSKGVPPSPLPAQKTAEAQPMVDCGQWNTKEYFQAATLESVTACLKSGADPNARDADKTTPLHWAAETNPKTSGDRGVATGWCRPDGAG